MTQFYSRNDVNYSGDVYSIPFDYIDKKEVKVYIDDELWTEWHFLNKHQLTLDEVPEDIRYSNIISVRRETDIEEKVVTYDNNSLLTKENLNKSQDQLLYAVQEIYDNNVQFQIDTDEVLAENKQELKNIIEENRQETLAIQRQFETDMNEELQRIEDELDTDITQIQKEVQQANITAQQAESIAQSTVETADNAIETATNALTIVNSANTASNNAVKEAAQATATAQNAVNIANTASTVATEALNTSNNAFTNASKAVTIANESAAKVDEFGIGIETVLDAAEKIFELDESVQTAVQAAELANQAAESATQAAEDAISTLDSKADKTDIKNGKLTIQANGSTVATFTANQEGDSTANIVIPDSAQWGKITGTLSNQTDLQNALNGKLSTTGTADKALKDSNGLQINTNYMRRTIGDAGIPATPTAPTALAMVGRQGCGNGNIAGGNLIALHKNTFYRCYERGSTITCNYEDKVANLGKTMCDGSFNGHYTQINPSTAFKSKPFVWEVTSPSQYEVSDVCRLHLYGHRLSDAVNATKFKIEAYIQDTLTNSKKWVTVLNYSGASKNIAQAGFGLYVTGYSSTSYYSIFGVRLTISESPDTIFRLSEIQLVASRGTELLADSLQCVSNAGGKIWGNLEVTGNLKASNSYTKTEVDNIIKANKRLDLFDTVTKDHILTYEESKGLGLQGTYVYKNAVAGSRYGYPDFYAKCLEEYENSTEVGITWQQPILTSNGTMGGNSFAVEASSNETSLPRLAYKSFDGNSATKWGVNNTNSGWLTFYNPKPLKVNSITYTPSTDYPNEDGATLEVLACNDNSSWESIWTGSYVANSIQTFNIQSPRFYKYYRISLTKGVSNWIGLGDLKINALVEGVKQNPNGHLFYDIINKNIIDEFFNITGTAWFYGIDTANERIFLPRNKYFDQATGDISEVGLSVEAGLPNITGTTANGKGAGYSGAFTHAGYNCSGDADSGQDTVVKFDASLCSPVYGKSDTVQPNAVKKLLYICVGNTEATSSITDVVDVTTTNNDTVPLFTGMYFDFKPNNASWLKAGQQSNSSGIYKTCYNELVNVLNGETKYGSLKVVDSSKMVSGVDYSEYWKVNQSNQTFTAPTKISARTYEDIAPAVGNGKAVTWTNGTSEGTLSTSNNNTICHSALTNLNVGDKASHSVWNPDLSAIGVTTYPTKSGIEAHLVENTKAQLYFKVANAVQNLELLDVGEVLEAVADKISRQDCKAYVTETYVNGSSWYRIWSDNWCEQGSYITGMSDTETSYRFVKPFINLISINIQRRSADNTRGSAINVNTDFGKVWNVSNTGFNTWGNWGGNSNLYWQASGYIA